ncbi:hypothetical protein [Chitinivorax sp. B]|uniref:hypothetical protein n=1 Tax=Chitinivorax sp. B TaxID=2502235 RepID=UPI0010F95476|nr:hypothetical protein [Chitinivorax sp. B]
MVKLVIELDPDRLDNPDLDLRYVIPDLLRQHSGGNIQDDGYDYESRVGQETLLVVFLTATDATSAIQTIRTVFQSQPVLGNHLSTSVILYMDQDGVRYPVSLT